MRFSRVVNRLFRQLPDLLLRSKNQEEPLSITERPEGADVGWTMAPLGRLPRRQEQHAVRQFLNLLLGYVFYYFPLFADYMIAQITVILQVERQ